MREQTASDRPGNEARLHMRTLCPGSRVSESGYNNTRQLLMLGHRSALIFIVICTRFVSSSNSCSPVDFACCAGVRVDGHVCMGWVINK